MIASRYSYKRKESCINLLPPGFVFMKALLCIYFSRYMAAGFTARYFWALQRGVEQFGNATLAPCPEHKKFFTKLLLPIYAAC